MARLSPVFYDSKERLSSELLWAQTGFCLRAGECDCVLWAQTNTGLLLGCTVTTQGCLLHSNWEEKSPDWDFLMHFSGRPGARLFEIAKDLSTNKSFCLFVSQMFKIWCLFLVRNLGLFFRNKAGFQSWFWTARGNHENSVSATRSFYPSSQK